MKYREILNETSMSDVATFMQQIHDLQSAQVDFDIPKERIYLNFVIDGERGSMRLSPKPESSKEQTSKKFRSRLYAAAIAVLGGKKPRSWQSALNTVRGTIRTNAVRILTNPKEWYIEQAHCGDILI